MPATVDFIFDFASPNAYLAYKALPGIVERTGATFAINPCLLGGIFKATGNQAPFIAYSKIRNKLDYERLELQRFIERHGLTAFQLNPNFPVKTLILMRGAIAAQEQGILEPYVEAGLRHMWEEGLKMDEPEVFAEAMNAAGLDGDGLLERTQDPAIKEQLAANTEAAVERGAFGIPTFFVGKQMFFGKERLGQVEEEIVKAG